MKYKIGDIILEGPYNYIYGIEDIIDDQYVLISNTFLIDKFSTLQIPTKTVDKLKSVEIYTSIFQK